LHKLAASCNFISIIGLFYCCQPTVHQLCRLLVTGCFLKTFIDNILVTLTVTQLHHILLYCVSLCLSVSYVITARRYAKRGICRRRMYVRLPVRLCVCVSVTLRYCIKMAKRRITQIMPHVGCVAQWTERRSMADELRSLSHARPIHVADG